MKGKIITREIFNSLVAKDGRFAKASQGQRNIFLQEIFNNTKKYLISYGIQIPATDGHTETQPLIGELTDMRLSRKRYKPKPGEDVSPFEYFSIAADIKLIPEFYQVYKEDRLPGASVDLALEGYLGSGQSYGPHIYSVSLMGQTPAAFPQLERENINELSFSMVPKRHYWIKTNETEFEVMPDSNDDKEKKASKFEAIKLQVVDEVVLMLPEIVANLIEKIASETDIVEEVVREIVSDEVTEPPAEPMPAPGEGGGEFQNDEEEKVKMSTKPSTQQFSSQAGKGSKTTDPLKEEMRKEIENAKKEREEYAKDRRELAFEMLVNNSNVSLDQKDDFMEISEKSGLDYAKGFFGKMNVKAPIMGSALKNDKAKSEDQQNMQFKLDYAKKQSLPAEVLAVLNGKEEKKEENK